MTPIRVRATGLLLVACVGLLALHLHYAPSGSPVTGPARTHADGGALAAIQSNREARGEPGRPNIVFISTDDQRLNEMRWMPYTRHLVGGGGVTFTDATSPHPLCCPAR